jgi:hypothetical protein
MISLLSLAADKVAQSLAEDWRRMFGAREPQLAEFVGSLAELALERIGNSDALFHGVQHTILVTLVGRDILRGRALSEPVSPSDWAHFLIACLFHDIGYVRGVLKGDREPDFVADVDESKPRSRGLWVPGRAGAGAAIAAFRAERDAQRQLALAGA